MRTNLTEFRPCQSRVRGDGGAVSRRADRRSAQSVGNPGSEHFRSVGALTTATIAKGVDLTIPVGPFVVDGLHRGYARSAPTVGEGEATWISIATRTTADLGLLEREPAVRRCADSRSRRDRRGRQLGRLFADLGAEVVKIESATYPDGLRQTPPGQVMSRSWALTHRNEYALGLDLRSPQGADIFSYDWSQAPTRCSPTSSLEHLRPWAFRTRGCAS